ncbi:carboxyl-terminal processing protease [Deinobacterium chartae]|uniref:Carboxyl-terminal processing protease n=1 Tax=Deinobacterium chartae TaxID=521158 RepID=A0A841HTJ2_9DEIO|nr:S41 family peptidase [Deinobacterium chartae]MBB6096731.1 carboxyl-terminal processing protease [Deinobacterium chartae]
MSRRALLTLLAACTGLPALAAPSPAETFEQVWTLIERRYIYRARFEPRSPLSPLPLPRKSDAALPDALRRELLWQLGTWQDVRDYYLERIRQTADADAAQRLIGEAVSWLRDDHSVYYPPERARQVRALYPDLPCLPLSGATETSSRQVSAQLLGTVGVLRIPDFEGFARPAEVEAALADLETRGARAFVLDLRGNPGGQLLAMTRTAALFERGLLWRLRLRGSFPTPLPTWPPLGTPRFHQPLAILIDANVHSAAEGFAGGLQARGRARIFGQTPSAGNVEAVMPYCLEGGALVMVATGQLAPMGSASWEGQGVRPDETGGLEEAARWAGSQASD